MTRRGTVRMVSFIAVALAVLTAYAIINTGNMTTYKKQLEVGYRHSLEELAESLDTVNTDLTKSLYVNSPSEMLSLSRDLYAQCAVAKNAVSRLPAEQLSLGNTYKFLSQASDYAQYIGGKLERGETLTEQEHNNLKALLGYAEKFSEGTAEMVRIATAGSSITEGEVKNAADIPVTPLANSFSESAKTFEGFPTLLYDGPFADQVLNKKSALLADSEVRTKEECRKLAAEALGVSAGRIAYAEDEQSRLPCYTFKSGRYTVSVTKQGGYIKSVLYSGVVTAQNITEANARAIAEDFLDRLGYKNMAESYYAVQNNVCTINFAYTEGSTVCYPDLIKVSVSMDNGAVLGLDTATYLTNHVPREAFSYEVPLDEAQKHLSPYLKVNGTRQCVIPKEDGREVACWEFACTGTDTGEDVLVYVNSATAQEEDILLLLHSDNGTMVK